MSEGFNAINGAHQTKQRVVDSHRPEPRRQGYEKVPTAERFVAAETGLNWRTSFLGGTSPSPDSPAFANGSRLECADAFLIRCNSNNPTCSHQFSSLEP